MPSNWPCLSTTSCKLLGALPALVIGGTVARTGLNTHPEFDPCVAGRLSEKPGVNKLQASDLFAAMAGPETQVALCVGFKVLAAALTRIADDFRLMGSGLRAPVSTSIGR